METGIILVLAVAGLCLMVIWYINGAMVTPVVGRDMDLSICIQPKGEAPELEHTVNGLIWLMENGTLSGEIVILGNAMAADARLRAQILEKKDLRVHYLENWESYGAGERID